MTRAKVLGISSAAKMLRELSCNEVVSQVKSPMLILSAKDDVVTKFDRIPVDDLKRCPNVLIACYEKGGHCDFFYEKKSERTNVRSPKEFMPGPTFAFFEQVDKALAKL